MLQTILPEDDEPVTEIKQDGEAQRALRIVLAITFTISAATCGLGINALFKSDSWLPMTTIYATAAVCLTVFIGAIIPKDLLPRLLVVYLVLLLIESLLLLVAGGLCLVLTEDIVKFIELENADLELLGTESTSLSTELLILGSLSVGLSCLLLDIMRRIGGMLGELHSMVTVLQTMNLMFLPIGLLTIALGLYFADTITSSVTGLNFAATIIIGVGAVLFGVNFLGCLASAVASRSLMALYSFMLVLLMSALLSVGISSLVLSSQVQDFVSSEWATIRFVLPPTFVGRYDQEAFSSWLKLNMKVVGFASIMTGLFCAAMLITSFALRHTFLIEREQRARQLGIVIDNVTTYGADIVEALSGTVGSENKGWMHLNKKHRLIAKFCGSCSILSFLVPIGLLQSLYMYDVYCESIADVDAEFSRASVLPFTLLSEMRIENRYPIGFTRLQASLEPVVDAQLVVRAAKEAYRSQTGLGLADPALLTQAGAVAIDALPSAAVRLMNRDVTCQIGRLTVGVPMQEPSAPRSLNVTAEQDILLDFSIEGAGAVQVFNHSYVESAFGGIEARGVDFGTQGGELVTAFGDISVAQSTTVCASENLAAVRTETELGAVSVTESEFVNCELVVNSLAGPTELDGLNLWHAFSPAAGKAVVRISNARGSVRANDVECDWFRSSGTEGVVRATDIRARHGLAVATTSGSVQIGTEDQVGLELGADGIIQVETNSGDVTLHLSVSNGFFGRFSIDTGTNNVVVVKGDKVQETNRFSPPANGASVEVGSDIVEGVSVSGNINCDGNSCNYGGEVIISSESGDISLYVS